MLDNIGGIKQAWYCFVSDLSSCAVTKKGITVNFKMNRNWVEFNASLGNIDISVSETETSGDSLFSIDGKIRCPRQKFENSREMVIFKKKRILVKYETINGDILVIGDAENPIKATHKILNPTQPSGYSGVEYTLSGVMTHEELTIL